MRTLSAVAAVMLFPCLLHADTVLLKSGGIMQGEVTGETDALIKLKVPSGATEKIRKPLIAAIVREEDGQAAAPEEVYRKKSGEISPNSAQAHYELGLFCLENSLLEAAAKEFSRARDIEPAYDKPVSGHLGYIDSVRKEAERIMRINAGDTGEPSLDPRTAAEELRKGDAVVPANRKDAELISGIVSGLDSAGTKEALAVKYIRIGDDYTGKAEPGKFGDDEFAYFRIAPLCYDIALGCAQDPQTRLSAEKRIDGFRRKSQEMKKAGLLVPYDNLERDAILLFIRNLDNDTERKAYYGICFYMGDEFKAKVKSFSVPLPKEDKKNLQVALNCYDIAMRSFSPKDTLICGLVRAKAQECRTWLRKDEEAQNVTGEGYSAK